MKKRVWVLIILLLSSILAAQEMNELKIIGKATLMSGDIIDPSIIDANRERAALITFITDLEIDMAFKPALGLVRPAGNPQPGRWEVFVSPGERYITVNALGYKEFIVVLSTYVIDRLRSGDSYTLDLTGDKTVSEFPVMLTGNQNGALVLIDGEPKGTLQNKMLTLNISSGEHTIRIEKDGFVAQEKTEVIAISNNSFHFELEPAMPAILKITTNPAEAIVFIDNNIRLGETPSIPFTMPAAIISASKKKTTKLSRN
jgi:hypothetical protein